MQGIPACKKLQKQLKRGFHQHAILRKNDVTKIAHMSIFLLLHAKYTFCMHEIISRARAIVLEANVTG